VAELFDPATREWSITGQLNITRSNHTATLLPNGTVLVAAGVPQDASGPTPLASVEIYDPVTQFWTPTGDLNIARYAHTATLLRDGRVLVVGGSAGGSNYQDTAELYDPAAGKWTLASRLPSPHAWHTATLLRDGNVLIAGGLRTYIISGTQKWSATDSVVRYDPATDQWYDVGHLKTPRLYHVATLLRDGKVLVEGGQSGNYYPQTSPSLASAEVYDPATFAWTAIPSLSGARQFHTATLLKATRAEETTASSRVLVVGGYDTDVSGNTVIVDTCEINEFEHRHVVHP